MTSPCDVEQALTALLALSELSASELRAWIDRAALADREALARALYPEIASRDLALLGRLLVPEGVR